MSVFVDTSVWYAAADLGDRSNARAKSALERSDGLVTSDHILVETTLLLRHRLGRDAAVRFWEALRAGVARLEAVTAADLEVAWKIAAEFDDQDFSVTDCSSFAVMHRLGITRAAALDRDFAVYRFGPQRRRAFDIVV